MVAAIAEGYPQREIADAAYRFQRELDAGERGIVGVNRQADPDEVLSRSRCSRSPRRRCGPSSPGSSGPAASATAPAVEAALARLRDLAGRPESSETNLMPALIECAAAYATLGEMCGVFRAVFGEYREPVAV